MNKPSDKPIETPIASDAEDFKKIVDESKERLASEPQKEVKKRGRPQGWRKSPEQKPLEQAPSPSLNQSATPAPNISEHLIIPIQALSKLPASKHKIPDLAFTPDEAKACAEAMQACINAFIPDVQNMSPKTGAVVSVVLTFGTIGFSKYQIYSEEMEKRLPKIPEIKPNETGIPEIPRGISATDHFARR